jgi:hypothetical protein
MVTLPLTLMGALTVAMACPSGAPGLLHNDKFDHDCRLRFKTETGEREHGQDRHRHKNSMIDSPIVARACSPSKSREVDILPVFLARSGAEPKETHFFRFSTGPKRC